MPLLFILFLRRARSGYAPWQCPARRLSIAYLGYPRGIQYNGTDPIGFRIWVRKQLGKNVPYDELARKIITASGSAQQTPEVSFLAQFIERKLENQRYTQSLNIAKVTGKIGEAFLGYRLQCAECHDHPFDKWSQDDFYAMTAFFRSTGLSQGRRNQGFVGQGISDHDKPLKHEFENFQGGLKPVFFNGEEPDADVDNLRADFARRLTAHPQFARALVNRIWAHFFGKGIIDPFQDFADGRKPVSPKLLDELALRFEESGYDLKALIRLIATSLAYQRTSRSGDDERQLQYFARARVRPLTPEQHFFAISRATDLRSADITPGELQMMRGSNRFNRNRGGKSYTQVKNWFIDLMAKTSTPEAPSALHKYTANTQQILRTMNVELPIYAGLREDGRLDAILLKFKAPARRIMRIFLSAYSRTPDDAELGAYLDYLDGKGDTREAYVRVFWSLLNSDEFLFNH